MTIKLTFFICYTFLLAYTAGAQCDTIAYKRMLKEGEFFAVKENYELAVKRFSAAMIACPDLASVAQQEIVIVFHKIESLKNEAVKNKKVADVQTKTAQSATLAAVARELLDKNPTASIRLAELSWKISPIHPPSPSSQRILIDVYYQFQNNGIMFFEKSLKHSGSVYCEAFSPDEPGFSLFLATILPKYGMRFPEN